MQLPRSIAQAQPGQLPDSSSSCCHCCRRSPGRIRAPDSGRRPRQRSALRIVLKRLQSEQLVVAPREIGTPQPEPRNVGIKRLGHGSPVVHHRQEHCSKRENRLNPSMIRRPAESGPPLQAGSGIDAVAAVPTTGASRNGQERFRRLLRPYSGRVRPAAAARLSILFRRRPRRQTAVLVRLLPAACP